ncbi:hypothetical protein [Paenibacillus zanthoxyli]|uniref:hypothetical protein n=1 Tax=Paenibacillus zanthoxyli TaxID=369399 RepID=UPI00046EF826|nr:hypothetical protein [Paenibacillus zanthoxyli]
MTLLDDAKCPYCQSNFEKPLSHKRTCPVCHQNVYVRTLPFKNEQDRISVAVTEQQAENIDIAWAKGNGTYDDMQRRIQKYEIMKKSLNKLWGREPSDSDIEWHLLLDEQIEHANNNQWGLYRNIIHQMAEHLYKLKEFDQSLRTYLNVLYLDLNGPNNAAFFNGKPNLDERAFDPRETNAFIAPGIIKRIVLLKEKRVCINTEELKILFLEESSQVYVSLKTPLTHEKAWQSLLEKNIF